MENIKIAEVCGLCAGCKHAINTTIRELETSNNVVIFKEIVHNKNVNQMLKTLGATTKENIEDLTSNEKVILRAHGEPPETYEYLMMNNIEFEDCTCVNVKNIHTKVQDFYSNGYQVVLLGKYKSKMHPEVLGTNGWTNYESILVEDESDLEYIKNSPAEKFYVVCQTTFNESKADKLLEQIENLVLGQNKQIVINKSICGAQKAINKSSAKLAENSDIMFVFGNSNSSNTVELFNNVSKITKAVFINDVDDFENVLKNNKLNISKETKIGITAGASAMREDLEKLKLKIEKYLEKNNEYFY